MFFGEYLVFKNIISEEQLLEVLTYQMDHLPSFLRILREEKIIPSNELFQLIKIQLETNSDLISVLRDENRIDEIKLHQLYQKQASRRKMIGEVIVDLKYADQAVIEKSLHEFLKDKENMRTLKKTEQLVSVKETPAEVEMSDAALESLRELGFAVESIEVAKPAASASKVENSTKVATIDPTLIIFIDEFLNLYNEKMDKKLSALYGMIEKSFKEGSDTANYLNSIYRDFHLLKGSASAAKLQSAVEIIHQWELIFEKALTYTPESLKRWSDKAMPAMKSSLIYLWKMREVIAVEKSEYSYQNSTDLIDSHLTLLELIRSLD